MEYQGKIQEITGKIRKNFTEIIINLRYTKFDSTSKYENIAKYIDLEFKDCQTALINHIKYYILNLILDEVPPEPRNYFSFIKDIVSFAKNGDLVAKLGKKVEVEEVCKALISKGFITQSELHESYQSKKI